MNGLQAKRYTTPYSTPPARLIRRKDACRASHVDGEYEKGSERMGGVLERATSSASSASVVPRIVHDVLREPGQPLSPEARALMEPHFRHDFSRVRVHTDAQAAGSAKAVNALAYTVGHEVVFASGQYAPETRAGKLLLAHELAHVVQQSRHTTGLHASEVSSHCDEKLEVEADEAANKVLRGDPVARPLVDARGLQRDAIPVSPTPVPACAPVEVFTHLDLPFYIGDNHFRGDHWRSEQDWNKELQAARKGKCEAVGSFKDVKIKWDLGNPNLGSRLGVNLNNNDITFDINPHVIYASTGCCPCFSGTAGWSFEVQMSRTKGTKVETGKTKAPIAGTRQSTKCDGKKCCDVSQSMDIGMSFGDSEMTADIKGKVTVSGSTSERRP